MNKFILVSILLSIFCVGFGQVKYQKVEYDFSKYEELHKRYYEGVMALLHKDFSDKPFAQYVVIPSFSSEYSFSVETIEKKHFIFTNTLSENYWYAENRDSVTLVSTKIEIDNELYTLIEKIFQTFEKPKNPNLKSIIGVDGITYFFSTTDTDGEIITNELWSPDKNSTFGKIVNICDDLYQFGTCNTKSSLCLKNEIKEFLLTIK